MADVDIHSGLESMPADHFGEVVSEFVPPIRVGELKSISTENKTRIRILNRNCRERGRRGGEIEVIVTPEVKTELIYSGWIERRRQCELGEMAGRPVRE
jgi:hypothetical protein